MSGRQETGATLEKVNVVAEKTPKRLLHPQLQCTTTRGEHIKEIVGHITETLESLATTAIWFVAILGVAAKCSFVLGWMHESRSWAPR
jgi:hypothetical protein